MASIPSDCQIEKTKIAFDELPKPCQAKDDNDAKISPTFAEKAKPKPMTAGNGKLNNMGALQAMANFAQQTLDKLEILVMYPQC